MRHRNAAAKAEIRPHAPPKHGHSEQAVERQHVVAVAELEVPEDIADFGPGRQRLALAHAGERGLVLEAGDRLRVSEIEHRAERRAGNPALRPEAIVDRAPEGPADPT